MVWTAAVLGYGWVGQVYYLDMSLMRHLCVICRMPRVVWREREMPEDLVTAIRDDRRVRSMLGLFGLLKFAEIPMIRSAGLLLNRLIDF